MKYAIRVETENYFKVQQKRGNRWYLAGYCEDIDHAEMYAATLRKDTQYEIRIVELKKPKITSHLV